MRQHHLLSLCLSPENLPNEFWISLSKWAQNSVPTQSFKVEIIDFEVPKIPIKSVKF